MSRRRSMTAATTQRLAVPCRQLSHPFPYHSPTHPTTQPRPPTFGVPCTPCPASPPPSAAPHRPATRNRDGQTVISDQLVKVRGPLRGRGHCDTLGLPVFVFVGRQGERICPNIRHRFSEICLRQQHQDSKSKSKKKRILNPIFDNTH